MTATAPAAFSGVATLFWRRWREPDGWRRTRWGFWVAVATDERRRVHLATLVLGELRTKDAERFIGPSLR